MGWDRSLVLEAVAQGPDLLTTRRKSASGDEDELSSGQMRQIAVAYYLLLDQKKRHAPESGKKN